MRDSGFTLMRTSNLSDVRFIDISLTKLIADNRLLATRMLRHMKEKLEAIEMEHRKQFRGEKLLDFFSNQTDYHFEKIFSAIHSPSSGNTPMGQIAADVLLEGLAKYRDALQRRGILNRISHHEEELAEVEYPLRELKKYLNGDEGGALADKRAAAIFAHFSQQKLNELKETAENLDEEYGEDIATHG